MTPLKVKIIIALELSDTVVRDADVITVRSATFPLFDWLKEGWFRYLRLYIPYTDDLSLTLSYASNPLRIVHLTTISLFLLAIHNGRASRAGLMRSAGLSVGT